MPTRTRLEKVGGRSGLAASPATTTVENINHLGRLKVTDQVVALVLAELLQGGAARVAQTQLVEITSYSAPTVQSAIGRLEGRGLLEVKRSAAWGMPNLYRLSESCSRTLLTMHPDSGHPDGWIVEPLPDCFRVQEYVGPGWLWKLAPKGQPMRNSDIRAIFPGVSRDTITRHLKRLGELPVPPLETLEEGSPGRSGAYHFHELSEDDISENLAWLMERDYHHRPKTLAERRGYHDQQRELMWTVNGRVPYAKIAPVILEAATQVDWPEDQSPKGPGVPWNVGCIEVPEDWRDKGGYGVMPGTGPFTPAHRIVWIAKYGSPPVGQELHHVCGNPACVNTRHMGPVTKAEHRAITNAERPLWQAVKHGKPITVTVPGIVPIPVDDDGITDYITEYAA